MALIMSVPDEGYYGTDYECTWWRLLWHWLWAYLMKVIMALIMSVHDEGYYGTDYERIP
jgi:hypothetical protein